VLAVGPAGCARFGQYVRVRALAIASVLCLVAVGCTSDGDEPGGAPTVTEQQVSSSTTGPDSSLLKFQLGHARLGPVQIGMTIEQAEQASGESLIAVESGSGCAMYRPISTPRAIEFAVDDRRIIVIDTEGVETETGVAVGDTADAISRAYASETVASVDLPAVRRVLVRPAADSTHATVFVLHWGGTVSRIRAGTYPEVERYEEGCP
jgi:hypothetical protein